MTPDEQRIVDWLRAMTASEWNALSYDKRLPCTFTIANAIQSGAHKKDVP